MAQITITINSREYAIACEDGQEGRILQLSRVLDEKAQLFKGSQINENMLLAMVGLMVADELVELKKGGGATNSTLDPERLLGIDKDVSNQINIALEELKGLANKLDLL